MSRTVPAVTDEYFVSIGPKCHVTCLDSKTGEFIWGKSLVRRFGAAVPPWYAGQCPLIDGGKAILAPAGRSLVVAVDCESGNVLWESPNPGGWKMTHSSIVPFEFEGERMFVYCASGGVAGVSAVDGRILWQTDEWTILVANVPSPVPVGEDRIFLAGGYNAGSAMLRLVRNGRNIEPRVEYRLAAEVFSSNQHTPIYYKGSIYGVRQDGQLACITPEGRLLWESGSTERFGLGPYVIASGLIYAMDNEGILTMAEAATDGFSPLARAKVLDGPDSWGPIAVAGGRFVLRDLKRMICLDMGR
jgi:outer membrane protein assembly factor BamB